MKKKKHPLKTMSKEMVGMTAGGMIAGGGAMALGKMGAPAAAVGGITAGASLMPAMGTLVGAKGVIGMAAQLPKALPKEMRYKKKRR